ncbi:MAG: hypothetical protein AB3N24_03130, partial [Leisingera sp.]
PIWAKWYSVEHPMMPPPMTTTEAWEGRDMGQSFSKDQICARLPARLMFSICQFKNIRSY